MVANVDGRVTTSRSERLLEPAAEARWRSGWAPDVEDLIEQRERWIAERYSPTVVLEGSGTFVADDVVSPWADGRSPDPGHEHFVDHLPRRTPRFFVVVDSRGRIDWQFTGDDETALIVLVCRATPSQYLRHLRDLGVGYLVVGEHRVDLHEALSRIGSTPEARTVLADGGGGINGALLRAGLIDEVHVITFPALVGGATTPSFVDGSPLAPEDPLIRLRSMGVVLGAHGSIWARYEVLAWTRAVAHRVLPLPDGTHWGTGASSECVAVSRAGQGG